MSRAIHHLPLLAVSICTAGLVAGCFGGEPAGLGTASRFVDEDPYRVFRFEDVRATAEVFRWTFDGPGAGRPWSLPGSASLRRGGLVFAPSPPRVKIERPVDFDASSIQELAVEVVGLQRGTVEMWWAAAGKPFAADRRIAVRQEDAADGDIFVLPVADHREWSGRIGHLRFGFRTEGGRNFSLRSIRGLEVSGDSRRLTAAVERPWKLDLGHEVRSGFLAPPGIALEREVEVPRGAVLEFGYGVLPAADTAVDFRVFAATAEGEREEIFHGSQSPTTAGDERWQDAAVNLGARAGQRLRLVFETASVADLDLTRTAPVWSEPRILAPVSESPPPNVVLIVIDTLRADRLSLYGYHHQTTPRIDAWAASRAVTFLDAIAPAPWTLPSHISIFSGFDALHHGQNYDQPIPESISTLAERLQAAGYHTEAVTGGVYLHPRFGFAQGFDRFRYWPSEEKQDEELADGLERVAEFLGRRTGKPFFLFFHTYETHYPFDPRQPFYDRFAAPADADGVAEHLKIRKVRPTAEDGFRVRKELVLRDGGDETDLQPAQLATVDALYDSGVAYADAAVGRIFDQLDELGGDTVVILTSDHGEALGEHGLAAHGYLYDFNLAVPMIVALPGGRGAGRRVAHQVRSVDILPTVLDVVGLEPAAGIDGASLLPLIEDPGADFPGEAWSYAASSNFGISLRLAERFQYIYNPTAWSAIHGEEEVLPVDDEAAVEVDEPNLERLRERVFEHYRERFSGLEVDFSNPGTESYRFAIGPGRFANSTKINALELDGAELDWQPGQGATMTLPPASSPTLYFEAMDPSAKLELALTPGHGGAKCVAEIDLTQLGSERVVWVRDAKGCRWDSGTEAPATADRPVFTVGFQLRNTESGAPPPEPLDAELAAKLRALGYLD